ncbi:hypothetical protein GCM10010302_42510 [Streptomyces polychromogenes]|uniref:Uncharacterized protein n=1 Tax=Streptomyces polychromogenes TaxID=67342 RepID=A0ABN0VGS2_9ACTN
MSARVCGGCGHTRGVHAPSLRRCLGAPGQGPACGCTLFWREDEPVDDRPGPQPCEECGASRAGLCRCESERSPWETGEWLV